MAQVLGGYDASYYVTERKWATAPDGVQIPISIVYRKNLVKLDGSDPLVLYGYGSYEVIEVLYIKLMSHHMNRLNFYSVYVTTAMFLRNAPLQSSDLAKFYFIFLWKLVQLIMSILIKYIHPRSQIKSHFDFGTSLKY